MLFTGIVSLAGIGMLAYIDHALQQEVASARERAELAARARIAVIGIDRSNAQLLLAASESERRAAALSAIREATLLEAQATQLDVSLQGETEARQLALLTARLTPVRMQVVLATLAERPGDAVQALALTQDRLSQIDALSATILAQQHRRLQDSVNDMTVLGRRGTVVLIAAGIGSVGMIGWLGHFFRREISSQIARLRLHRVLICHQRRVLEMLARAEPLERILARICGALEASLKGRRCHIAVGRQVAASPGTSTVFTLTDRSGHPLGQLALTPGRLEAAEMRLVAHALRMTSFVVDRTRAAEAAERELWHQANLDPLTGLPNRRLFARRLHEALAHADRVGSMLTLLCLDLDGFKDINDTLGHHTGDVLLADAAARLRRWSLDNDLVARTGGDEFAILLLGARDRNEIAQIAEEVRRSVTAPFVLADEAAYLSASIGITVCPDDGSAADILLRNADQAMYAAKGLGKNCCVFFETAMQDHARQQLRLTNDLRGAIAEQQLEVYYQPIFALGSGLPCKAEALVRWHHRQLGWISPADFIPMAERAQLIENLGAWVYRQAVLEVAQARRLLPDFQISVNVSPLQLRAPVAFEWAELATRAGIPAEAIELEITEGVMFDDAGGARERLDELRRAGFALALDDFGTGYSSLSYLHRFPITTLKIDRSFTRHLAAGSREEALCEAIILMAHTLGLQVTAEGIETEEQLAILREAGCEYGQGFVLGRPQSAGEFRTWLAGYGQAADAIQP